MEQTIESNRLLEEKRKNSRHEQRLHQFKQADWANGYANVALRTIIVLNAGALSLMPAYISAFELSKIDPNTLRAGMVFFAYSILAALTVYLLGYMSSSFGARASIQQADCEYWILGINHVYEREQKAPKEWHDNEQRYRALMGKWQRWADRIEILAIIAAIVSMSCFFLGAMKSIQAFPADVLVSEVKQISKPAKVEDLHQQPATILKQERKENAKGKAKVN